jgi:hypothetical protein
MTETIYRCTCDRCGKKVGSGNFHIVNFDHRRFHESFKSEKSGEICEECFQDFRSLAESFFDGLNKGEQA